MRDTDLYARILGVEKPWEVSDVELRLEPGEVKVRVEHGSSGKLACPVCGQPSSRYDVRWQKWRHLDTCQYRTILAARVPRVECAEHGVKTIAVPWSEPGSSFTALFEALVIDWLRVARDLSEAARLLGLSWDQVDGIYRRSVKRGLARRELRAPSWLGVDETSFQKRHEYVSVAADLTGGFVQHVANGRGTEALAAYYESLPPEQREQIQGVAMDMWQPYIAATMAAIPDAGSKIAFDKFHVAMHLSQAVDRVRRQKHRQLIEAGDETLKRTKYLWLSHPDRLSEARAEQLGGLMKKALKTGRAWALKELAMEMWECRSREEAREVFRLWYASAIRSRLAPIKAVARTLKRHLEGILNVIHHGITDARLEGLNTVIQTLKRAARGFRSRDRFRAAIYFHLGGLDLYPDSLTHSKAG